MNWLFYMHKADFPDLKKLRKAGAGEEQAKPVSILFRDSLYIVRRWNELDNKYQDVLRFNSVFEPIDLDDLCDHAETLMKLNSHRHVLFCSSILHFCGKNCSFSREKRRLRTM